MGEFQKTLDAIKKPDPDIAAAARSRQANLTKPPGSLGRLEWIACRVAAINGDVRPKLGKKRIVVFVADHGVSKLGVSAYPREVTGQMLKNFLDGGAAINAISRSMGIGIEIVDIGVDAEITGDGFISHKIRRGTSCFTDGPAMSKDEAVRAIEVGIERAKAAKSAGCGIIGTGEMGIGNTTSASALLAAYLNLSPREVVGRGTGVDDAGIGKKAQVIGKALDVNKSSLDDPLDTLAALGGFEIAGMCGLALGAASLKLPVVIDGFISGAAALAAMRIKPEAGEYFFFSHLSMESGHRRFYEGIGENPLLDLDLRLGEGTGAALAMGIIEAAVAAHNDMATFDSAGVSNRGD